MDFRIVMHFIHHFGYFSLIILFTLGLLGIPIPDEIILGFVGFLSYQGEMNYFLAVGTATLGSILGMNLSYWLGNKLGRPFFQKYGHRVRVTDKHIDRMERWLLRYEGIIIIIGYFIPGVRHITSISSGIIQFPIDKFNKFTLIGALIWTSSFITMGYLLGEKWSFFIRSFQQQLHIWVIVLSVSVIVIAFSWKYIKSHLKALIKKHL